MHELVRKHAANFALVQQIQNALRTAHRSMTLVASRRKRVRRHSRSHINARHRLIRAPGQFAHNRVQRRLLLLAHLHRLHGSERELVGKPVATEGHSHGQQHVHAERAARSAGKVPNQKNQRPHKREQNERFKAVRMTTDSHFYLLFAASQRTQLILVNHLNMFALNLGAASALVRVHTLPGRVIQRLHAALGQQIRNI